MTTIAAVQGSSWVVIGADSQVSEDNKKYRLPDGFGKLVRNGEYLFGVAGDLRAVNILTHDFRPPAPRKDADRKLLDKFMTSRFIPKLKSCFDMNFYGKDSEHGSMFVVAVRGVIYEVGSDYDCIRDERGLYSVGSGSQFALGALHALDTKPRSIASGRGMVRSALMASCSYDSGTSEPVTIVVQGS
jgi:ATP-dependent protease HslVU (ClpYQ) peptidase subunit